MKFVLTQQIDSFLYAEPCHECFCVFVCLSCSPKTSETLDEGCLMSWVLAQEVHLSRSAVHHFMKEGNPHEHSRRSELPRSVLQVQRHQLPLCERSISLP